MTMYRDEVEQPSQNTGITDHVPGSEDQTPTFDNSASFTSSPIAAHAFSLNNPSCRVANAMLYIEISRNTTRRNSLQSDREANAGGACSCTYYRDEDVSMHAPCPESP